MERLTDEQLAEIHKRAEAATMGDWDYDVVDHGISNGNFMVAMAELDSEGYPVIYAKETDLDFITNAREDIPRLLAEIERLKRFERLVENTSEEEIREYFEQNRFFATAGMHSAKGAVTAIKTTLDILGIKIEGVNA